MTPGAPSQTSMMMHELCRFSDASLAAFERLEAEMQSRKIPIEFCRLAAGTTIAFLTK